MIRSLHQACLQGHANVATAILEFQGASSRQRADVNAIARDGWTALHAAAKRGDRETIQLLISKEADLTAKDKNRGDTPLMVASFSAHFDAVKTFLSKGNSINTPSLIYPINAPSNIPYQPSLKFLLSTHPINTLSINQRRGLESY